jgi:hypothetical protein
MLSAANITDRFISIINNSITVENTKVSSIVRLK